MNNSGKDSTNFIHYGRLIEEGEILPKVHLSLIFLDRFVPKALRDFGKTLKMLTDEDKEFPGLRLENVCYQLSEFIESWELVNKFVVGHSAFQGP